MTTRAEWLKERRTGLGGSDAAPAAGLSKWMTPLELWMDKRGELERRESEPMRWGTLLEPLIRQEYANRTGRTLEVRPYQLLRHPKYPFLFVTPDGIANAERLYEGKTARTAEGWGQPGTNEIPMEYTLQVQHGLMVLGLVVADVAVLVGGQDLRVYEVEADSELQEMLLDREAAFWAKVQNGSPPDPVSEEDIKRRWRFSNGSRITASPEIEALVERWTSGSVYLREEAEMVEGCKNEVRAFMGEAAELVSESGELLATWKNCRPAAKFDAEKFREAHPDLYKQFLTTPQSQRRLLSKVQPE